MVGESSAGESQPDGAKLDAKKSADVELLWNFARVDTPAVPICSKYQQCLTKLITRKARPWTPGEDVGEFPLSMGLAGKKDLGLLQKI